MEGWEENGRYEEEEEEGMDSFLECSE